MTRAGDNVFDCQVVRKGAISRPWIKASYMPTIFTSCNAKVVSHKKVIHSKMSVVPKFRNPALQGKIEDIKMGFLTGIMLYQSVVPYGALLRMIFVNA